MNMNTYLSVQAISQGSVTHACAAQAMAAGYAPQPPNLHPTQAELTPSAAIFNPNVPLATAIHGHHATWPAAASTGANHGTSKGRQGAAASAPLKAKNGSRVHGGTGSKTKMGAAHVASRGAAAGSLRSTARGADETEGAGIAAHEKRHRQQQEAIEFQPRSLKEWREDANNPKSPAYRCEYLLGGQAPVDRAGARTA
jgi:hypothetical protein